VVSGPYPPSGITTEAHLNHGIREAEYDIALHRQAGEAPCLALWAGWWVPSAETCTAELLEGHLGAGLLPVLGSCIAADNPQAQEDLTYKADFQEVNCHQEEDTEDIVPKIV
jgi:hypothetical protein